MAEPGLGRPLRLAVHNVVDFHLHVVAGALHVLRRLSSAPVTAFLTPGVLVGDRFGFSAWLGRMPGVEWRRIEDAEAEGDRFDLVWFLSPEWDVQRTRAAALARAPRVALLYVHNGHMPAPQLAELAGLCSPGVPLLGMGPHVAEHVARRLDGELRGLLGGARRGACWLFPTAPWHGSDAAIAARRGCGDAGTGIGAGAFTGDGAVGGCRGRFCIAGSTDPSLRDYGRLWGLLRATRERGSSDGCGVRLDILGEVTDGFSVPGDLHDLVTLHDSPSDPEFYAVSAASTALLPALAHPAYYVSKLTSAVITSFMTCTPLVAEQRFLDAYRMLTPAAVLLQAPGEDELAAAVRVAALPDQELQPVRSELARLRRAENARAEAALVRWLSDVGLEPDARSAAGSGRCPEH